ncbi:MAG: STM3941 family protein [Alphaproteobacteria bacterium]
MRAEFAFSRRKLANGLAGALAFVATAVAVVLFAVAAGQPMWAVAPPMLVIAAFFGLVAATHARRFSRNEPVLTIDEEGIHDRRLGPSPVPWPAVSRLETVRVWGHDVLEVKVADPAAYLKPPALITRILIPVHRLMGYSPLLISPAELDASFGDLLHAVQRFRSAGAETSGAEPAPSGA